jgi:hypothetical protein
MKRFFCKICSHNEVKIFIRNCKKFGPSTGMDSRSGVVAVLFLIVVAFIFGAISLSMQTGQIIERRISADQAADSAVVAFASKSSQGLNYISANNLAIAGAAHMVGALHLSADWLTAFSLIWKAKPICQGGTAFKPEDYQQFYEYFRPISKLYFKSAVGLTTLNGVIKVIFPYLGMLDAIRTGAANSPSTLIFPFGAPSPQASSATTTTFKQTVSSSLKNAIHTMLPNYQGLTRMNSDETFCISYRASKTNAERDNADEWMKELGAGSSNTAAQIISQIAGVLGKFTALLGFLDGLHAFQIGFSGCGFGKEGPVKGGGGQQQQVAIASMLMEILRGPISGRTASFSNPNSPLIEASNIIVQPPKDATSLKAELGALPALVSACDPNNPRKGWKIGDNNLPVAEANGQNGDLETGNGVCLVADTTPKKRYAHGIFSNGQQIHPGESPTNRDLVGYRPVCFGEYLFDWKSYSGIKYRKSSTDPASKAVQPIDAPANYSDPVDREKDICPEFEARVDKPNLYPQPERSAHETLTNYRNTFVGLNRTNNSFLEPILARYSQPLPQVMAELPAQFPGRSPVIRDTAFEMINAYLKCASKPDKCPWPNLGFKNTNGVFFMPNVNKLNWLCPIGDAVTTEEILRKAWQFSTFDSLTWSGNKKHIQDWHNGRVETIISNMNCAAWRAFNGAPLQDPPATTTSTISTTSSGSAQSHNYCTTSSHMCWQKAMQDSGNTPGKDTLGKGNMSFLIPKMPSSAGASQFEQSLHYAVLTFTPLRTDQMGDINGGGGSLPHCPNNMEINATLGDGVTTVPVCDIVPVIGMLNRTVTDATGAATGLDPNAQISTKGVDMNLASGGMMKVGNDLLFGRPGFIAIAQAGVKFKDNSDGAPAKAIPAPISNNYKLFWPSWYPAIEPSRVMSNIMPAAMAPLLED